MKPQEIEKLSFQIIDREAGNHGMDNIHWPIVRRMVHTSADFEYLQTVRFGNHAVEKGMAAIQQGCQVFTDTNMARVGIRKKEITHFGGTVSCLMADPKVAALAAQQGTTRALAAVDLAADQVNAGIYVVGNAPTALLRLIELIEANKTAPALVIGLPVGFVNAVESKEALLSLKIPYITNTGRKGGSNVAAAVFNALAIMAHEKAVHETR
ncbi:MAG: precorrin-8X methylmutase [Thermodesulfobacteriota bacterium]